MLYFLFTKTVYLNPKCLIMKPYFSIFCFFAFFMNVSASSNTDVFSYDKEKINQEFAQLNELETFVGKNIGCTYTELELTNNSLIKNVAKNDVCFFARDNNNPPLDIPSFLWGCCFNVSGMMIVYMMMDGSDARPEQMDKAFKGCITSFIVGAIGSLIYTILMVRAVSSIPVY